MANFDWNTRVYSINDKKQDLIYVGEARLESIKGYQPFGAGVLYDKRGEQIIISESLPDITGATIKSNSIQTTLGIYQKGELTGPAILSDITGVTLSPFSNKDNKPIKAIVKIPNSEEYFISQIDDNGVMTGKTIHYKLGRFYLEYRNTYDVETTPIKEIECSWDFRSPGFSYPIKKMEEDRAIRPVNVTSVSLNGKPYYKFEGGAQIASKKLITDTYDDGTNIEYIREEANGYGVCPLVNGSMYAGEFKKNKAHGMGCISYENGNKYVGNVSLNLPGGPGMLVTNDEIAYSSFYIGLKSSLTFEFTNDNLYIKVYGTTNKLLKHDFFEINLNTFDIKRYSNLHEFKEDIPFSESNTPVKELSFLDKLHPDTKKSLEEYEYTINDKDEITVTKCNSQRKIISVPGVIKYIKRRTFENLPVQEIVFPDSVIDIEGGAIYNCNKLKNIEFGKGITKISTDITNKLTTRAIIIPKNVTFVAQSFRYCRFDKVYIKNPDCIFFADSFPKGCKIYLDGELVDEKTIKKASKAKDFRNKQISKKSIQRGTNSTTTKEENPVTKELLNKMIKKKYSPWTKIKNFFKELPSNLAGIFTIPFKKGVPTFDFIALVITLIGITSVVLGLTGVLDKIVWTVTFNSAFGYSFNMSSTVFEFMTENVNNFSTFILYGIWLFLLTVILWIIDLVLVIILFIISLLWLLIQSIGQVALLYLIPIASPILLFLRLKYSSKNNDNFIKICLVLSLLTLLAYIIGIIIIKNTNATPLVEFIIGFNKLK